jgi:ribosomal-protein-alanine N-acetyltransferase
MAAGRPALDLIPLDPVLRMAIAADPVAALAPHAANAAAVEPWTSRVAAMTRDLQQWSGASKPWIGYLAIRENDRACVGTCAFKGPPRDGAVEIAYFTFPPFEGQGVASAMAGEFVARALAEPGITSVIAHTLAQESPATAILRRLGFAQAAIVQDPDDGTIWR